MGDGLTAGTEVGSLGLPILPLPLPEILTPLWTEKGKNEGSRKSSWPPNLLFKKHLRFILF